MATSHERLCLASEQVVVGHDWVLEETVATNSLVSRENREKSTVCELRGYEPLTIYSKGVYGKKFE
jgi:hypothetical protein